MAAVYSEDYNEGPGTRLFYQQSTWIQEFVWTQSTDIWTFGSPILGSTACSRLAVIEDYPNLRLFYVAEGLVLQEMLLDITQTGAIWRLGEGFTLLG